MEAVEKVDADIVERLQSLIDRGMSYEEISHFLCTRHPSISRGLSARSIRRFCASRGIGKRKEAELDHIISQSVSEVSLYGGCGYTIRVVWQVSGLGCYCRTCACACASCDCLVAHAPYLYWSASGYNKKRLIVNTI